MKYYFFGTIAVIGIIGTAFGAWAKITHQVYADTANNYWIDLPCGRYCGFSMFFIYVAKKEKLI